MHTNTPHIRFATSLILLVLALSLDGCVVWNFTETRYQNATGFFNTYYNASKLFSEAEEEIRLERQLVDNSAESQSKPAGSMGMSRPAAGVAGADGSTDGAGIVEIPGMQGMPGMPGMQGMSSGGLKPPGIPSGAVEKLDRVIAKCSRILVDYRKSKWVDNALLLIGKAHFYKQEYTRAERKFKELLDGFPESALASEALLWMGKNYAMIGFFDEAEEYFDKAIERGVADDRPEIVAESYYSRGEMLLARGMEKKAVESFEKGAGFARGTDMSLQILLALAREQEKLGDKKAAAKSYKQILQLNPDREVSFYSELSLARLSRETGQIDDAVNTLVDMLDSPAYLDYDGQIQLEIGRLYESVTEYAAALDQYRFVDTTFRNKPESAEAAFALGRLYEVQGKNYDKAFEFYSEARTNFPGGAAAFNGGVRADMFGEYRRQRNRMFETDTLLFYVLHPDSLTSRDSVQAIADSVSRAEAKISGTRAVLSDEERQRERFARRRPHGRNTGRVNPYDVQKPVMTMVPQPLGTGGTPAGGAAASPAGKGGQPLYRRFDLRKLSADSVLQNLSILRMDMGWILFDKLGDLDSASYYYRLALDGKLPDSVKANAYYTLSEIARQLGDSTLAADYENRLIRELPNTRYALSVMRDRGIQLPKDSLTVTREAYERAARVLEQGNTADGLEALAKMKDAYPHSEQAVRAKLAIAMTYEKTPGQGEKALEMYKGMVKDHPKSPYSKRAKDILDAIDRVPKEEEARRKKEEEQKKLEKEKEAQKLKELQQSIPTPVRDTTRNTRVKKKTDPTQDIDFPLNLPGDVPQKGDSTKGRMLRDLKNTPELPGGGDIPLPGGRPPQTPPEEESEPLPTPSKGS
ncbi:MAG: tetratricopeptide repeat protein [Ignavibacteria bacterium]|nr:tetratricopeptide repeat protein [Ignavibacteria bacterium]